MNKEINLKEIKKNEQKKKHIQVHICLYKYKRVFMTKPTIIRHSASLFIWDYIQNRQEKITDTILRKHFCCIGLFF